MKLDNKNNYPRKYNKSHNPTASVDIKAVIGDLQGDCKNAFIKNLINSTPELREKIDKNDRFPNANGINYMNIDDILLEYNLNITVEKVEELLEAVLERNILKKEVATGETRRKFKKIFFNEKNKEEKNIRGILANLIDNLENKLPEDIPNKEKITNALKELKSSPEMKKLANLPNLKLGLNIMFALSVLVIAYGSYKVLTFTGIDKYVAALIGGTASFGLSWTAFFSKIKGMKDIAVGKYGMAVIPLSMLSVAVITSILTTTELKAGRVLAEAMNDTVAEASKELNDTVQNALKKVQNSVDETIKIAVDTNAVEVNSGGHGPLSKENAENSGYYYRKNKDGTLTIVLCDGKEMETTITKEDFKLRKFPFKTVNKDLKKHQKTGTHFCGDTTEALHKFNADVSAEKLKNKNTGGKVSYILNYEENAEKAKAELESKLNDALKNLKSKLSNLAKYKLGNNTFEVNFETSEIINKAITELKIIEVAIREYRQETGSENSTLSKLLRSISPMENTLTKIAALDIKFNMANNREKINALKEKIKYATEGPSNLSNFKDVLAKLHSSIETILLILLELAFVIVGVRELGNRKDYQKAQDKIIDVKKIAIDILTATIQVDQNNNYNDEETIKIAIEKVLYEKAKEIVSTPSKMKKITSSLGLTTTKEKQYDIGLDDEGYMALLIQQKEYLEEIFSSENTKNTFFQNILNELDNEIELNKFKENEYNNIVENFNKPKYYHHKEIKINDKELKKQNTLFLLEIKSLIPNFKDLISYTKGKTQEEIRQDLMLAYPVEFSNFLDDYNKRSIKKRTADSLRSKLPIGKGDILTQKDSQILLDQLDKIPFNKLNKQSDIKFKIKEINNGFKQYLKHIKEATKHTNNQEVKAQYRGIEKTIYSIDDLVHCKGVYNKNGKINKKSSEENKNKAYEKRLGVYLKLKAEIENLRNTLKLEVIKKVNNKFEVNDIEKNFVQKATSEDCSIKLSTIIENYNIEQGDKILLFKIFEKFSTNKKSITILLGILQSKNLNRVLIYLDLKQKQDSNGFNNILLGFDINNSQKDIIDTLATYDKNKYIENWNLNETYRMAHFVNLPEVSLNEIKTITSKIDNIVALSSKLNSDENMIAEKSKEHVSYLISTQSVVEIIPRLSYFQEILIKEKLICKKNKYISFKNQNEDNLSKISLVARVEKLDGINFTELPNLKNRIYDRFLNPKIQGFRFANLETILGSNKEFNETLDLVRNSGEPAQEINIHLKTIENVFLNEQHNNAILSIAQRIIGHFSIQSINDLRGIEEKAEKLKLITKKLNSSIVPNTNQSCLLENLRSDDTEKAFALLIKQDFVSFDLLLLKNNVKHSEESVILRNQRFTVFERLISEINAGKLIESGLNGEGLLLVKEQYISSLIKKVHKDNSILDKIKKRNIFNKNNLEKTLEIFDPESKMLENIVFDLVNLNAEKNKINKKEKMENNFNKKQLELLESVKGIKKDSNRLYFFEKILNCTTIECLINIEKEMDACKNSDEEQEMFKLEFNKILFIRLQSHLIDMLNNYPDLKEKFKEEIHKIKIGDIEKLENLQKSIYKSIKNKMNDLEKRLRSTNQPSEQNEKGKNLTKVLAKKVNDSDLSDKEKNEFLLLITKNFGNAEKLNEINKDLNKAIEEQKKESSKIKEDWINNLVT